MAAAKKVKVRPSLYTLQTQYEKGNKKPLEDLVRAWKGIKELPSSNPNSFFVIGGYHGEPFQYRKKVDKLSDVDRYLYWGGWCNHGNILFPTWHRVYVYRLEQALQTIVPGVMMAYWDECSDEMLKNGIPWVLTNEKFELDGVNIDNPLRSFILPKKLTDYLPGDDKTYVKPKGYETVRYPLSGLVGTKKARAQTDKHNAQYPDYNTNVKMLNDNVMAWLKGGKTTPTNPNPQGLGVYEKYKRCLSAPNYTVFSNTTSAAAWARGMVATKDDSSVVVPLESPHNSIHLAVGGFDVPELAPTGTTGQVAGANGDMGENNTAGLDPIFFFHHCFIDRMFWLWQKNNGQLKKLNMDPALAAYPGTSSYDSQGPTPTVSPGATLSLKSELKPFEKTPGKGDYYTSEDCIDTEGQLGYTYEPGSFEGPSAESFAVEKRSSKRAILSGIDRALFEGSFVLKAYATVKVDGKTQRYLLGHEAVLSRRNVIHCANCLTHMEVAAHFSLDHLPDGVAESAKFGVEIDHRGAASSPEVSAKFAGGPEALKKVNYHFEVLD